MARPHTLIATMFAVRIAVLTGGAKTVMRAASSLIVAASASVATCRRRGCIAETLMVCTSGFYKTGMWWARVVR